MSGRKIIAASPRLNIQTDGLGRASFSRSSGAVAGHAPALAPHGGGRNHLGRGL